MTSHRTIWTRMIGMAAMAAVIAVSSISSATGISITQCTTPPKVGYYSFPADQVTQLLKQIDDQTLATQNQHTQYVDKVMTALEPQLKELLETGKTASPPAKPDPASTSDGSPSFSMDEPSAWDAMTEPMRGFMRGETMVRIEPVPESRNTQRLLDSNPRQVLPNATDLAAEGKDLEKTFQQQIDGFKQLNTLLSKLLKDVNPVSGCLQSDITTVQGPCADFLKNSMTGAPGFCDEDALKTYVRVAKAYVAALFSQKMGMAGGKLVSDHLLVNYLMDVPSNLDDFYYFNTTPDPIAIADIMSKMPLEQAMRTDEALSLATRSAIDILKVARPEFAAAVRIELLRAMAPLLFAVNDRTKHLGPFVPSRMLLVEYVSRINNKVEYSYGKSAKTRTDHNRIPAKLALFNPGTQAVVDVPLCKPSASTPPLFLSKEEFESDKIAKAQNDAYKMSNGTSGQQPLFATIEEFMPKSGGTISPLPAQLASSPGPICISFKAFANVAVNPIMLGDGKKPFFDWAQVGNNCGGLPQGTPPPKTSWVDTIHHLALYAWDVIQSLAIGTAYAGILSDPEACAELEKFKALVFCKDEQVKGCVDEYYGNKWCNKVWTQKPPTNPGGINWYKQCTEGLTTFCKGDSGIAPESEKSKDVSNCAQKCAPEKSQEPACKLLTVLSKQLSGQLDLESYFYSPGCTIPFDIEIIDSTTTVNLDNVSFKKGDKCNSGFIGEFTTIVSKCGVEKCLEKCATCGNGIVETPQEGCEPPNSTKGIPCDSKCKPWTQCEKNKVCSQTTPPDECIFNQEVCMGKYGMLDAKQVCGNGAIEKNEQCDDGNFQSGDGCANCAKETGKCGNGKVEWFGNEQCDDGNTADGDGCSAKCQFESGICGNGKNEAAFGEECDDGNAKEGDGCDGKCKKEWCPQCSISSLAECAEFNQLNTEALNSECTLPAPYITKSGKTVCLAGEHCSCPIKYTSTQCTIAQNTCQDECKKTADPKPSPQLPPTECKKWKDTKKSSSWWKWEMDKSPDIASSEAAVQSLFMEKGFAKYLQILPAVTSWAEHIADKKFSSETLKSADNHAFLALFTAGPGDFDSVTDKTVAQYTSGKIRWGKDIQIFAPDAIVNTGAHEAVHAYLDKLLGNDWDEVLHTTVIPPPDFPLSKKIELAHFLKAYAGVGDHLIMQVIQETYPDFNDESFVSGGTQKDDLCPKNE